MSSAGRTDFPYGCAKRWKDWRWRSSTSHSGPSADEVDLVLPESRKAAVIGPRPIVIAGDESTLDADLHHLLEAYRPLFDAGGRPLVSLAEAESATEQALRKAAPWAEIEVAGMLRIKGLERSCVVFSDR